MERVTPVSPRVRRLDTLRLVAKHQLHELFVEDLLQLLAAGVGSRTTLVDDAVADTFSPLLQFAVDVAVELGDVAERSGPDAGLEAVPVGGLELDNGDEAVADPLEA